MLGPLAQVFGDGAFDDAGADAQPPVGQQVVQDAAADGAGQVDDGAGDDVGSLGEQVAGGVQGVVKLPRLGSMPLAASIASVMAMRRIW